eukprot:6177174-Pleurochrysis_carterae.AAC.5
MAAAKANSESRFEGDFSLRSCETLKLRKKVEHVVSVASKPAVKVQKSQSGPSKSPSQLSNSCRLRKNTKESAVLIVASAIRALAGWLAVVQSIVDQHYVRCMQQLGHFLSAVVHLQQSIPVRPSTIGPGPIVPSWASLVVVQARFSEHLVPFKEASLVRNAVASELACKCVEHLSDTTVALESKARLQESVGHIRALSSDGKLAWSAFSHTSTLLATVCRDVFGDVRDAVAAAHAASARAACDATRLCVGRNLGS